MEVFDVDMTSSGAGGASTHIRHSNGGRIILKDSGSSLWIAQVAEHIADPDQVV